MQKLLKIILIVVTSTIIISFLSAGNQDSLNYSITNIEVQKKGGSFHPLQPPKYTLVVAKVALSDNEKPNRINIENTLKNILIKLQKDNNADAITIYLYESKENISFFSQIEWWPQNHSLSRKNNINIINKATYKTDIKILSLPQITENDTPINNLPIKIRQEIFREKSKSELEAIRAADKKYDVVVQWKQHMKEIDRITEDSSKKICLKYNISEDALQNIIFEGVTNNW